MSSRGIARERQVRSWLEERDWLVIRSAGSLGCCDLVALRPDRRSMLIEVKSTISPYSHFAPTDRRELRFAAELGGCDAYLAWWPSRGQLRWIPEREWPQ